MVKNVKRKLFAVFVGQLIKLPVSTCSVCCTPLSAASSTRATVVFHRVFHPRYMRNLCVRRLRLHNFGGDKINEMSMSQCVWVCRSLPEMLRGKCKLHSQRAKKFRISPFSQWNCIIQMHLDDKIIQLNSERVRIWIRAVGSLIKISPRQNCVNRWTTKKDTINVWRSMHWAAMDKSEARCEYKFTSIRYSMHVDRNEIHSIGANVISQIPTPHRRSSQ